MMQYVDLLTKILTEGEVRADRTGVGTKSIFGGQLEFDLREAFPLVTIKKTLWRSAFIEMLWFIRGESNTKFLKDHNVPIWDDWADENGNLGPVYGVQWRKWPGRTYYTHPANPDIKLEANDLKSKSMSFLEDLSTHSDPIDQLKLLIDGINKNPTGRRHIVTAWNPTYLDVMGLPPCHRDFQCYASNDGSLDLMLAIRSWDVGLGAPFNIAQYALLTHMIARATNRTVRRLIINYGDAHVYLNHVEPLRELLTTARPRDCFPQLHVMTHNIDIDKYEIDDFGISDYQHGPFLKLPIAV